MCCLRDEQCGAEVFVGGFDAGAGVDAVADDSVFGAVLGADVADDNIVGVNADTDVDGVFAGDGRWPLSLASLAFMRRPARTARVSGSGASSMAPKEAMIPSPMNLSSTPPCSMTASTISEK